VAYTFARRTELAKERGFSSYYDQRRSLELANADDDFIEFVGPVDARSPRDRLEMAKLHRQAFSTSPKDDYSVHVRRGKVVVLPDGRGAKAKYLIEVAEYVDDVAQWRNLYPTGSRYGHLVNR
jgi:hypothetical protein